MVLKYIAAQKHNRLLNYDFMVLNAGLHDVKTEVATGKILVPLDEHKTSLREIFLILKEARVKAVWIRTTGVVDKRHNARATQQFHRFNKDVLAYNAAADVICAECGIMTVDLYSFTEAFGDDAYIDHVHYNDSIKKKQGEFIADKIKVSALGKEN